MSTWTIPVAAELLEHAEHLPETIECSCGYVRDRGTVIAGFVCPCGARGELYEGATDEEHAEWYDDIAWHDYCEAGDE